MAPKSKPQPEPQPQNEPLYPSIEGFIEKASSEDVSALFSGLKGDLSALKGPKAEQGKKALKSLGRTEELLSYLLQVREKIQAERKGGGKGRK
ncbi:MAG: hypothetical protein IT380_11965 [Myxococcales bacterium]|nr:hypothetical protein [Myxococcales bacterium]